MKLRFLKDGYRVKAGDEFYSDSKEQIAYLKKHKIAEVIDEKDKSLGIEGKDTREVVQPDVQYVPKVVETEKPKDPEEAKPTKPVEAPKPPKPVENK